MSGDALLQIKDFSVAFRQSERETLAVDRISFEVKKGETLAVVGESARQIRDRAFGAAAVAAIGASSERRNPVSGA